MAIPVIFGIANCDTVKKARHWLDDHLIKHEFHDFRRDGLTTRQLKDWLAEVDMDVLLNKRSRTWRELDESLKSNITQTKAIKLMLDQPSIIKRPVLELGNNKTRKRILVGFDGKQYESLFIK